MLIGPNGAGKTTLFHCVTGTLEPSAGRVALFGRDVTRLAEHRRTALGMGRTFQITNLFGELTSAREHRSLAHPRHRPAQVGACTARRALRRRARAGARGAGGRRSRAIAPDEPVKTLSYGERRQLELALALDTRPQVLFLDEPCAGLSPSERQKISRMIAALPREITLVMIEHDMDVALGLADRVTVLHRGRVILEGIAGRGAGATPRCARCTFWPCLSRCSRCATSTPTTATATCCRASTSSFTRASIVAILGRNGMGKTTLIRSVAGLTPPRDGDMPVQGTLAARPAALRDRAGRHRARAAGTAHLPLALGAREPASSDERARRAARRARERTARALDRRSARQVPAARRAHRPSRRRALAAASSRCSRSAGR